MDKRLHILRSYETLCYRVCYCLLEDEKLAAETAKLVLLELVHDSAFYQCPEKDKKEKIRKISIKRSLSTYYENCV